MPVSHKATGANLALVAVGAALIAASTLWGGYTLGSGVPITLQTLAVLLAGAILGAYRGAAAVFVYLALGTAGLPVWAGHIGGPQIWTGLRAGFLISFVVAAFLTGWMTERVAAAGHAGFPSFLGITSVGSLAVISVLGWAFLGWRASMSLNDTLTALTPFLPGDILKAFLAAIVATSVHAAYPGILIPRPLSTRAPFRATTPSGSESPRSTVAR